MNATQPHDPSRDGKPTVAEVAALTRRLRELSTAGRDVDPAERAAFLADKDALLARIAHQQETPARRGCMDQGVTVDENSVVLDDQTVEAPYVAISRGDAPLAARVAALRGQVATDDAAGYGTASSERTDENSAVDEGDAVGDAGWAR